MAIKTVSLVTGEKETFIDITDIINGIVSSEPVTSNLVTIFVPHTTAGIMINENADPDVVSDITKTLRKLIPDQDSYKHFEGNSAAHIKSILTGSSVSVPVSNGKMLLGRWQGVYFCEFDGPRIRSIEIVL